MKLDHMRGSPEEVSECHILFREAILHAAVGDSIDPGRPPWVAEEIVRAEGLLQDDLASGGEEALFIVARLQGRVVGSIARIDPGRIIRDALPIDPDLYPEIGCLFVLPEYHRRGIASLLFSAIVDRFGLERREGYVLDCGYRSSQRFWLKKLGEPDVVLKDYWGKEYDHMIWRRTFA